MDRPPQSDESNNSPASNQFVFSEPHETVKIQDALDNSATPEQKTDTVRTFQSDIASSIKSDNISMIKVALAEKERQEKEGAYFEVDNKKTNYKPLILIMVICAILAIAIGFVYWYFNRPPAPTLEQLVTPQEPMILYSETQSAVSVAGKNSDAILADLRKETLAKLDLGTIKRILITNTVGTSTQNLTAQEFLREIRSRAPDSLVRAINPYFFIGAYSFDPHDVFIIFKINSYDTAYPAMLEWERSMELDLGKLFIEEKPPVIVENTAVENATTSPDNTSTSSTKIRTTDDSTGNIFKDKILQNKDVRALINPDGNILFMYTFLDRQTLLIVSSEKGLKEVIYRMTTGRIKR